MSPSTLLIDQRFSYFCAKGENDIEQLCCVLRVLGTPSEESWPVSKLFFLHCNPNKNVCTEMRGPLSHVPVRWGPISRRGCRVWGHAVQWGPMHHGEWSHRLPLWTDTWEWKHYLPVTTLICKHPFGLPSLFTEVGCIELPCERFQQSNE